MPAVARHVRAHVAATNRERTAVASVAPAVARADRDGGHGVGDLGRSAPTRAEGLRRVAECRAGYSVECGRAGACAPTIAWRCINLGRRAPARPPTVGCCTSALDTERAARSSFADRASRTRSIRQGVIVARTTGRSHRSRRAGSRERSGEGDPARRRCPGRFERQREERGRRWRSSGRNDNGTSRACGGCTGPARRRGNTRHAPAVQGADRDPVAKSGESMAHYRRQPGRAFN